MSVDKLYNIVSGIEYQLNLFKDALKVLEKEEQEKVDEAYQKGYDDATKVISSDEQGIADKAYQRGLDDAWEAAKKIADMWTKIGNDELLAIFGITERIGQSTIRSLFEKQTANEAMLELEAYEEKQDDKIEVEDEVAFHHDDRPDTVVVVTYIGPDGFIDGCTKRTPLPEPYKGVAE